MTDQLTATGLTIDAYATRLATITGELRTAISAVLDFGEDQPTGQIVRILTEHDQQLAELLQELHSAIDPDQATGQSLDALCSITGTYRNPATVGTVTLACTFTDVVVLPLGTQAAVSGDPDNLWEVVAAHTSGGAGVENVAFQATETGVIPAVAGTITVIQTPVAGWTAVNNVADATPGTARETDTALRLRREVELATGGSTSVDAVAAVVSAMTGMLDTVVYENDTWRAVSPMPPHSIEVVYWDGGAAAVTPADLVEEIFEEKAGGIQAYGSSTLAHVDTQGNQGNDHQIGMTPASEQRLELDFVLVTDGNYPGNTTFIASIVAAVNANQGIGDDVLRAKLFDFGFNVAGVLNITTLQLRWFGAVWGVIDLTVADREIATLDTADVSVAP